MIKTAFGVAILAALAFAYASAVHAQPAVVGLTLALFFFAVAIAAGAIAVSLNASNTLTEPRKPHGPTTVEPLPPDVLPRTELFGRFWALTLGALGVAGLVPVITLARKRAPAKTAWRPGMRLVTADGVPVRADDVAIGGVETVFPEGNLTAPEVAVLLIRVDETSLRLPAQRAGWTPSGNVAYSKICTHAGCPVALYRRESCQLACPCHQSVFDVRRGAAPVSGPAPRALPQLPLAVDRGGYLIAAGEFSDPVGPDEWDHPV